MFIALSIDIQAIITFLNNISTIRLHIFIILWKSKYTILLIPNSFGPSKYWKKWGKEHTDKYGKQKIKKQAPFVLLKRYMMHLEILLMPKKPIAKSNISKN